MTDCIFCEIVAGNIPSYKIYEDEKYLAFLDIMPWCEGHTLVIPKEHVEWVWDLPSGRQVSPNLGEYFEVVGKIARHHRALAGGGARAMVYGWEVPHAHIHIKPGQNDGMKGEKIGHEELERIAKRFKFRTV